MVRIFPFLPSGISVRSGGEVQEGHGFQCPVRQWKSKPHLPSGHAQRCHWGDGRANVRAAQGNGGQIKGAYVMCIMLQK